MRYDEKDICEKCGKKLDSDTIEYTNYHDGGCYKESYRKVNRNSAKTVGLGFYCNDCYDNIGNNEVGGIIKRANYFLENDLTLAIEDVKKNYELKIKQLTEVQEYIKKGISFLEKKNSLAELSKEEMEHLLKRNNVYQPNYRTIETGFCWFDLFSEVQELYNNNKRL